MNLRTFRALRKRVAETALIALLAQIALPGLAFAAPPTFTATEAVANALAIEQVETLDVPRVLEVGDSVSLTVSGTVLTQNFQVSHAATMNALAAFASALPNVSATFDSTNNRLVFNISTTNPTPVSIEISKSPISGTNAVANVVAIAQVVRIDVPQTLIPGDVVSITVAGSGVSVPFSGTDSATLSGFAAAIDSLAEVSAELSGRSIAVTASVPGSAFGISNLSVVSSDVAVNPVVANVVPVAQVERVTLNRPLYSGDVVAVSLSGVNLSQAFSGDTTTTMTLLASQIEALSFADGSYSAGDLTITASVPGAAFSISPLTVSGSALASVNVTPNNVAVAQVDAVVLPRQTVEGDSVRLRINSTDVVETFSISHADTMSGLVAAISALPNLTASYNSGLDVVTVESTVPGTPFTLDSAVITTALSSTNVVANVPAVAQVSSLSFSRDFASGDELSVVINGNTVTSSFTGTHADMVEDVRAQIDAMPNVDALASSVTRIFTVSSSLPWMPFSLSSATLRNTIAPVVLQNNVQAVRQTSVFEIAPTLVTGDTVSIEIGSGSVSQAFLTTDSDTVDAFVAQLDLLSMFSATYDSGTRSVTLVSETPGTSFTVGKLTVSPTSVSGTNLTPASAEARASVTVTVDSVPTVPMALVLGACTVTVSGGLTIDASSSDCSDGAAEIDPTGISSTDTFAQLLRGISGYSYSGGTVLSVSGSGSNIVLTRATAQVGTDQIPASSENLDLSPNADFSFSHSPISEAVAQVDSVTLPRALVAGDALSLTLSGVTFVQNVGATPATDFANFVSNLDALSDYAVSGDYGTRTITVTSENPGESFGGLQASVSHSSNSRTVVSAVGAVAQRDSFTLPHAPIAGETITVTVNGTPYSQVFDTDSATTLNGLVSTLTIGGVVNASLTGSTTVILEAANAGTPFTVGGVQVLSNTAPVQVTANVVAGAQKDTLTVPFVPVAGDTLAIAVGTGSATQTFATDADTTLSLLNTAVDAFGIVASSVDLSARTFTFESKTPGTAFSASLSASGTVVNSTNVVANEIDIAQIEALSISRSFGAGDSLSISVDGSGTTIGFDTDTATTVANLAAWIDSLPSVSAIVWGSEGNFIVTITAEVPGTPFVPASLTVNSTLASTNVVANVVAVAQVDEVTVPRDLVAGDTLSLTLSGSAPISVTYSGSEADTLSALAAQIDALSGVSATVSGKTVTVTAEIAGVPFDLSPLSLSGDVPTTVTQNNVVAVAQVDEVTLPALVSGDEISATLNGHSVSVSYAGSESATLSAFASALSASGTVSASASGSTIVVTAAVAGTPFVLGTVSIVNEAFALVNVTYVPPVAQVAEFDVGSATEGWTFTATVNGVNYAYLSGSGDTDESIESALAAMIASDTGAVLVSTGASSFTLTAAVAGIPFTFSASAADVTAPVVSTPVSVAQTLKSGDTSTSTVASSEDGTIYAVASGTVVSTPSDITSAMVAGEAFVVSSAVKNVEYVVTIPVGIVDGPYDFVAVDASGNVSGAMLGWLAVDNTPPLLVISTPSGQTVHAVSMTVTGATEPNATLTVTGSANLSVPADASGNFSVDLPLAADSFNEFFFSLSDLAGNVTERIFTVTEDGIGPAVTLGVSGTSYASGATFAFTGQTEPNLSVSVVELSSGTVASSVSDGSGDFNFAALPLRLDSLNDFTVVVTDLAGNAGTGTFSVVQDNIDPVVVLDALPVIVDADQIDVSGVTDSDIAVSVTDGTSTYSTVSSSSGTFSVTAALTQNASNVFSITATDLSGRTWTASATVVEDSVANALVISTLPATLNADSVALTGSTKPNSALTVVWGAATLTGSADVAGLWGFSVDLNQNATNVLEVESTDLLGNVATGSVTFVEDSVAPVVMLSTVDHATYSLSVTVAGTTEPFATVTIVGGSGSVTTVADSSGNFSALVDLVADNANALVVTATDAAGNFGSANVTVTHDSVVVSLSLDQSGTVTTNQPTFAITGTSKPGASFQITGGASVSSGTVDGSGALSSTVALTANASNALLVTVTDQTLATAIGTVTVVHDDVAPTISFGSYPTLTNQLSLTVTGSTDPLSDIVATDLSGATFSGSSDAFGDFSMTLPLAVNSNNAFSFSVTDAAGNVGTGSVFGIIQDSNAPVQSGLSFASSIVSGVVLSTYSLSTDESSLATVFIGTASNVALSLVWSGSTLGFSHSGTVVGLSQGTTYYAYSTAIDGAGNVSQTPVMSFITATDSSSGGGTGGGSSSGGSSGGGGGWGGGGGGSSSTSNVYTQTSTGTTSSTTSTGSTVPTTSTGTVSGQTGDAAVESDSQTPASKPTAPAKPVSQAKPAGQDPQASSATLPRKNDASTTMVDVSLIPGFVTQKYVNVAHTAVVRSAPNHVSKAVTYLPRNYPVTVLEYGKNWSKVTYDNGVVGYVRSVFLRDGTARDRNRTDPYLFVSALTEDRLVDRRQIKVAHSIFLRSKPDIGSKISGWLYGGDIIFILDQVGEWSEIRTPSGIGFVKTKFLTK